MSNQNNGSGASPETDARAFERYRSHAVRLIPLNHWRTMAADGRPLGKTPLHRDWPNAIHTFEEMRLHLERGFNVGIRLGNGHGVLDYDPRNDPTRDDPAGNSLVRLSRDTFLDLTACPVVNTGGGGQHVYIRIPRGMATRELHPAYPGVEAKHSPKRFVVCAGSIHPCGKLYTWRKD